MSRQQRAEETLNRILEVAEECFAQKGYATTGIAEICQRAGVSKGAFYHHFPSKQALFLTLLNRWLGATERQLEASRSGATGALEGLLGTIDTAETIFQGKGEQLPILLEFWAEARKDPVIWEAAMAPLHHYRQFFAEMIEKGIAEGSLRADVAENAATVMVSLALGLLLQGMLDPEGANWGGVAQDSVRIVLEGLARR